MTTEDQSEDLIEIQEETIEETTEEITDEMIIEGNQEDIEEIHQTLIQMKEEIEDIRDLLRKRDQTEKVL